MRSSEGRRGFMDSLPGGPGQRPNEHPEPSETARNEMGSLSARGCSGLLASRWAALAVAVSLCWAGALGADPSVPGATGTGVGKLASLQNQVETKGRSAAGWTPASLYQVLHELDRVRTGPGSRAAILYSDRTLNRIGEKSEIEIRAPSAGQPGILKVVSGTSYFSSRSPKDYGRIETPTVTAAIKGTEFVVEVAEDQTTKITMIEGVVEASNSYGTITVGAGEQAYVESGKAPQKRIVVRPRDAVAWALDYPSVLAGADATRLEASGQTGKDLAKAAGFLSTGQVDLARPLIEAARASQPKNPVALALASVIEVTNNRRDEAMKLAEAAVAADPTSAAAALALSFAAQAQFDIPRARATADLAAKLDSSSGLALARAAELRMAEGDINGAMKAAAEAAQRTPGEPRALAVQGFVELARYRSKEAEALFQRAVAADPSFAMSRLGLGIALIRLGKVVAGREQLQTAVLLDPDNSLLRSYLGKALYEEKLTKDASKEFAAAKSLDPLDPTPWLYDSILKENTNRPVESLRDLNESVKLNDNRAVYRSRMLLDDDRAVRASDLARVYNDLGFEQLGLVTARRAADENQANFSSHLFLAANYRTLPLYAPAFFSEILQGRIYEPVSVNAVRPDVVNEAVSFNEYTALMDRPRFRLFAGLGMSGTDSNLSGMFPNNPFFRQFVSIPDSSGASRTLTLTLNGDRFAGALSADGYQDDGFRFNNDREINNYRGFFQFAPTWQDNIQINFQRGLQYTGDQPVGYLPVIFGAYTLDSRLWNAAAGYHHMFAPGSDFAASFIFNATRQTGQRFYCDPAALPTCVPIFLPGEGSAILRGPQFEVQQVLKRNMMSWVFGAGGFRGTTELEATGAQTLSSDDQFTNAYAYLTIRPLATVDVTVGAAGEWVKAPTGLLPDTNVPILPADLDYSVSKFSPKLGVTWRAWEGGTLRAAWYERLSAAVGRIQTLEPTQVAGFNQFYREPGGTWSRTWGAAVDQAFGSRFFAGLSYQQRNLDIPQGGCDNPSSFSWCSGQVATTVDITQSVNDIGSGYFNYVITRVLTFALEGSYIKKDFDYIQVNNDTLFEDYSSTWRVRPGLRFFLPNGFFVYASATFYDQIVHQSDNLDAADWPSTLNKFWTQDMTIGYRLPDRWGSFVLEGHNVSDRQFDSFDREVEDTLIPARSVILRFQLTY